MRTPLPQRYWGVGLAGFYIFPATIELKYVKSELLTSGYYDFHPHFVYFHQLFDPTFGYGKSVEGPNDGMSFQFGIVQWGIILLAIITLLLRGLRRMSEDEAIPSNPRCHALRRLTGRPQ